MLFWASDAQGIIEKVLETELFFNFADDAIMHIRVAVVKEQRHRKNRA